MIAWQTAVGGTRVLPGRAEPELLRALPGKEALMNSVTFRSWCVLQRWLVVLSQHTQLPQSVSEVRLLGPGVYYLTLECKQA